MIRIQNIYHMLAYAFQVLREQGYRDVATEEFSNTAELCAEILARGVSSQLKRGLGCEYVDRTDALSTLRGKIEVTESVKTRSVLRRQMVCSYDEFSVDTRMNRVLKATMMLLVRSDIDKARKKELKRLLVFFGDVNDVDLSTVDWHMSFDRNNQTYRMLMNVCWLVVKGLLQTQADGSSRLMDFLDEQRMSHLYEKFILKYYRDVICQGNTLFSQPYYGKHNIIQARLGQVKLMVRYIGDGPALYSLLQVSLLKGCAFADKEGARYHCLGIVGQQPDLLCFFSQKFSLLQHMARFQKAGILLK